MIFLPYRADVPIRRTPMANYVLIGLNVAIFAAEKVLGEAGERALVAPYYLWPQEPSITQFISYQFLHGDVMHLGANLLFLWVFGNSVNAKMGQLAYTAFYLSCGVLAGTGFLLTGNQNPCLGASGAIAGVTTAFLVLFPTSEIAVFYWLFIFVGVTSVNSMLLIVGKMILYDNLIAMRFGAQGMTHVAYSAHLVGYAAGFLLSMLMLYLRAVPRDQFDLLAIWKRARQRRAYAAMMADPAARAATEYGRVAQWPPGNPAARPPRPAEPVARLREEIAEALSNNDLDGAAARYEELVALDAAHALPRSYQLTIANQLMTLRRFPQAADAYERYLQHHAAAGDTDQVKLLLGIIYARYLGRYEAARRYLSECIDHLTNPQQREQAGHWLQAATAALGGAPPA